MKKFLLLLSVFATLCWSCSKDRGQKRQELIRETVEKCATQQNMVSDETVLDLMKSVSVEKYAVASEGYRITCLDNDEIDGELKGYVLEFGEMSVRDVKRRILSALPQFLMTNYGKSVYSTAAGTLSSSERVYVDRGQTEDCAELYFFEDAYPVAILYNVGEDGAIKATCNVVFAELSQSFVDDIRKSLLASGYKIEKLGDNIAVLQ